MEYLFLGLGSYLLVRRATKKTTSTTDDDRSSSSSTNPDTSGGMSQKKHDLFLKERKDEIRWRITCIQMFQTSYLNVCSTLPSYLPYAHWLISSSGLISGMLHTTLIRPTFDEVMVDMVKVLSKQGLYPTRTALLEVKTVIKEYAELINSMHTAKDKYLGTGV